MTKTDPDLLSFSHCMSKHVATIFDRSIAFLYFYAVKSGSGVSLSQIINDFKTTGLGNPNITKLRRALATDRRTMKSSKDIWQLKSDKVAEVERRFQLSECLEKKSTERSIPMGSYINRGRYRDLKKIKGKYDLTRLLKMLSELDNTFQEGNYISVILLIRAILDHIPPVFGFSTFPKLANNYGGAKSFKESMLNLENSSRKIADAYLHVKIRDKEALPNNTQVNFSRDLDVLLAEIVRIS